MSPSDAPAVLPHCWQSTYTWPDRAKETSWASFQNGLYSAILVKGDWPVCAVQKGWYRLGQALHGLGLYDEAVMALSTGETLEPE